MLIAKLTDLFACEPFHINYFEVDILIGDVCSFDQTRNF